MAKMLEQGGVVMASKQNARVQLLPFLIYPYIASFVLFLYLPHTNVWWRMATCALAAFSGWHVLDSYRRKAAKRRALAVEEEL